eukprot:scaffold1262_cov106-Cylindrotheca_fusiformis.AAC.11
MRRALLSWTINGTRLRNARSRTKIHPRLEYKRTFVEIRIKVHGRTDSTHESPAHGQTCTEHRDGRTDQSIVPNYLFLRSCQNAPIQFWYGKKHRRWEYLIPVATLYSPFKQFTAPRNPNTGTNVHVSVQRRDSRCNPRYWRLGTVVALTVFRPSGSIIEKKAQ